tara:strand:- start:17709 stop:18314 length:606 start_codon:yes stop_codon:yes gene_type:complete
MGLNGEMPWRHSTSDLKRFSSITNKRVMVMGRKTWESVPEKYRPFPDRLNVVLTRQENYKVPKGVVVFNSIDDLTASIGTNFDLIGGGNIVDMFWTEDWFHETLEEIHLSYFPASSLKPEALQLLLKGEFRGEYDFEKSFSAKAFSDLVEALDYNEDDSFKKQVDPKFAKVDTSNIYEWINDSSSRFQITDVDHAYFHFKR